MKPNIENPVSSLTRLPALSALALGAALAIGSPSALADDEGCPASWSPNDGTKEFSTNDANPSIICVDIDENGTDDFVFTVGDNISAVPGILSSTEESASGVLVADYHFLGDFLGDAAKGADGMAGNRIQTIAMPEGASQAAQSSPSEYFGIAAKLGHNTTIDANTMENSSPVAFLYAEGGEIGGEIGDHTQFNPDSRGFLGLQVNLPCVTEEKNGCPVHYAWLEVEVKNGSLILRLIASEFNPAAGGAITTPLAPVSYVPPPRPVPVDGAAPWAALGLLLAGFAAVRRRRR